MEMEVYQGKIKGTIFFVKHNEAKKYAHDGCPYCEKQLKYAKKHKLRVIINKYTMDIIGVEI